jgi:hypothetical protein
MTSIEILVVGVTAYILTERSTRIDVANSLVVGEKVDTFAYPAWVSNIPIETKQSLELPIAADITPQVSNPATSIAFLV